MSEEHFCEIILNLDGSSRDNNCHLKIFPFLALVAIFSAWHLDNFGCLPSYEEHLCEILF